MSLQKTSNKAQGLPTGLFIFISANQPFQVLMLVADQSALSRYRKSSARELALRWPGSQDGALHASEHSPGSASSLVAHGLAESPSLRS